MRIRCLSAAAAVLSCSMLFTGISEAKTVLRLGHIWTPSEIHSRAAVAFAEEVSKLTDGELTIQIFGGGALGQEKELLEGMKIGANDMWIGGSAILSNASETAKILSMPFMFDSIDHFKKVYDGKLGEELTETILKESGYKVLAYWVRGPRWLTTKASVRIPEDLSGMKIRVPESPVSIQFWRGFGAAPTPMNFGEVYTALQQGVIDGQENPLSLIYTSKFSTVVKYLGKTEHVFEPIVPVIHIDRFNSLTPQQQEALIKAANGVAKTLAETEVVKGETDFVALLKKEGMTVVDVDKAAFQARAMPVLEAQFPALKPLYERFANAKDD